MSQGTISDAPKTAITGHRVVERGRNLKHLVAGDLELISV